MHHGLQLFVRIAESPPPPPKWDFASLGRGCLAVLCLLLRVLGLLLAPLPFRRLKDETRVPLPGEGTGGAASRFFGAEPLGRCRAKWVQFGCHTYVLGQLNGFRPNKFRLLDATHESPDASDRNRFVRTCLVSCFLGGGVHFKWGAQTKKPRDFRGRNPLSWIQWWQCENRQTTAKVGCH